MQAVVNVHFPFSQLLNLKIVNVQRKLLDKVIMLQAAMVAWGCAYSLWKYRLWKISAKLRISLTVTWLLERAQTWVKPKEVRILLSDIIGTRVERSYRQGFSLQNLSRLHSALSHGEFHRIFFSMVNSMCGI